MPKRILSNFDFTSKDAHIALVDVAANGTRVLLKKSLGSETEPTSKGYADMTRWDRESQELVPLKESGLRVSMSLEDILMFFTHLFPEDIETLTSAIEKAASGADITKSLSGTEKVSVDALKARQERLATVLAKLDQDDNLAGLKLIAKSLGSEESQTSTEKEDMTTTDPNAAPAQKSQGAEPAQTPADGADGAVPESVQKALDETKTENAELKKQLEVLSKEREERRTAEFVAKAESFKGLGLPEPAEENGDPVSEFGAALKTLHDAAPEAYATVESVLTKAVETLKNSSALEEVGASGQPEHADNDAELNKVADEIQKAEPTITREAAIAKAYDQRPDLYPSK